MQLNESILEAIVAFFLGHKYYANIVNTRGTSKIEIASYIFPTRQEADAHKSRLQSTRSFQYVETISFRSRKVYGKEIQHD